MGYWGAFGVVAGGDGRCLVALVNCCGVAVARSRTCRRSAKVQSWPFLPGPHCHPLPLPLSAGALLYLHDHNVIHGEQLA